ncbi:DNA-processing protein DprA [Subtercola endophyticus]|uniref:DNA-processing protein DprA n=1 Tax=Subtercola endophyticus TaxID=2895559 RepID=UPI001E4D3AE9|nr:DNA-processing protein DprA [Subtercola endophyticus]UFS60985.1 DNA-processing protein DprA [Subtercola endophyticus]
MTIFSLDETIVSTAVKAITHRDGEEPANDGARFDIAERFARATWSGLAEPGDVVAGTLVRALGAPAALGALLERHKNARILEALAEAGVETVSSTVLSQALDRWAPRLGSTAALNSMQSAARCGARLIVPSDAEWPTSLADLGEHEPLALWVRGRPAEFRRASHSVALVGARAATGYGEHVAMEMSAGLSDRGVGVVSGAAYGIDGMAHRAALASSGFTVAFLAGGVDRFYPSGHDALLTRIASVGAVVSEMPCGSPPTKWRFLQRNRLIAALSRATVVVEAGTRSGSLNTAAHAAAIGRPLGAVPGPVTSASSAGCHRLLREYNAECVTNSEEVIGLFLAVGEALPRRGDERGAASGTGGERGAEGAGEEVRGADGAARRSGETLRLMDALSNRSARRTEELAKRAGLGIDRTRAMLGVLQVAGDVIEVDLGWKKIEP